jgi:hypothetical protein
MNRDKEIEELIIIKSKSSRYLDLLSFEEKKYLDDIFFFLDSYKCKVKALLCNTFSRTNCLICGKENEIPYNYVRKEPKKYCSNICAFKSEENRKKNSDSQKNKKYNPKRKLDIETRFKDILTKNSILFTERNSEIEKNILLKKNKTSQYHTILTDEELCYLNSFWSYAKSIKEKVFLLENNIFERLKCLHCMKELESSFISTINKKKYLKKYCNSKCKNESIEIRQLISKSVSESYKKDFELSKNKAKSGMAWREKQLPSGKIVLLQGYEDLAIEQLLENHKEDDIVIHKGVPIVKYFYKEIMRSHFADFYIKSTNTLIDVKSNFTLNVDIEKIKQKKKRQKNKVLITTLWL